MHHDLTPHDLPLADLTLLPGNPRKGDIGAVSESMRVNGVYQPIIVNKGTKTGRPNEIIAGNHRAQAAKALGHETIPAIVLDLTDEEAKRIALADNRTSDLADYDNDALLLMLQDLPDLAGTGYDGDDLDDLLARMIANSTRPGNVILDTCAGSGSIMIAAHHADRAARMVELDPAYGDVICRRWQEHTGHAPHRNGEPIDFTQDH